MSDAELFRQLSWVIDCDPTETENGLLKTED
jgi:hypothetical protein